MYAPALGNEYMAGSQGHPVCLKNSTIVLLPSSAGNLNNPEFGALVPKIGVSATSTGGGGGVCHDFSAFGTCRSLNGFAKGKVVLASFEEEFDGEE